MTVTNYTAFHLFVLGTGNLIIKLTVSQGALCQEKKNKDVRLTSVCGVSSESAEGRSD